MTATARFNIFDEQDKIDEAIERYLDEHPELNPAWISVTLVGPSPDGEYEATGHVVLNAADVNGASEPVILPTADRIAEPTVEELAEAAFGAYANWHGHTNHTMDVAEGWANQGPDVRAGFLAGAKVVRDMLLGQPLPDATPAVE